MKRSIAARRFWHWPRSGRRGVPGGGPPARLQRPADARRQRRCADEQTAARSKTTAAPSPSARLEARLPAAGDLPAARRRGDLEAAVRDFRRAGRCRPHATRPLEALGDALYQLQRYTGWPTRTSARSGSTIVRTRPYKLALARYRSRAFDARCDRLDERSVSMIRRRHALLLGCACARRRAPKRLRAIERRSRSTRLHSGARRAGEFTPRRVAAPQLEQLQVLAASTAIASSADRHRHGARARRHWDLAVLTLGGALELHPTEPEIYPRPRKICWDRPRRPGFLTRRERSSGASSPSATSVR